MKNTNTNLEIEKIIDDAIERTQKLTIKSCIIDVLSGLRAEDRIELLKDLADMYQSELDVFGESK